MESCFEELLSNYTAQTDTKNAPVLIAFLEFFAILVAYSQFFISNLEKNRHRLQLYQDSKTPINSR